MLFLLPRLAKESEGCFSCVPRWSSFQIGHGRNRSRRKVPAIRPVSPLPPRHYIYIRRSLCQLRPRREKRIHRQHYEQYCRWILFLWKRKARIRCAGEKMEEARRWRSAPHAARMGRKKVGWRGMKKSGDALLKRAENRKARRRVEKQRGHNRKTRNRRIKAPGPKSERARGPNQSARARNQKACNLPTTL